MSGTVCGVIGHTILLFGGTYFDFETPESSNFTIEDIAHGLAMTCRYGGQCGWHYSVAQHSIYVSQFVPTKHAYAGLMHDAPEAFIGDMAKPLKMLCPDYSAIEDRVETEVFRRFNVPSPLPLTVKEADMRMLATEQRQLMNNADRWHHTHGFAPYDLEIEVWSPTEAEARFLDRFNILTGTVISA